MLSQAKYGPSEFPTCLGTSEEMGFNAVMFIRKISKRNYLECVCKLPHSLEGLGLYTMARHIDI